MTSTVADLNLKSIESARRRHRARFAALPPPGSRRLPCRIRRQWSPYFDGFPHAIRRSRKAAMDLQTLQEMSAEKLDELFSDSEAGDIPNGPMEGTVLVSGRRHPAATEGLVKRIAWQGKTFDASRAVLTNRLPLAGDEIVAEVFLGPSWYDQAACIVLDYYPQSVTASRVRDELRQLAPGLYLGKAYEGRRPLIHFALTGTL